MLIELKNGRRRNYPAGVGKVLVRRGIGVEVLERDESQTVAATKTYETRMLQDEQAEPAPYGYKADGTPRKRPGRQTAPKAEEEE